MDSFDFDIKSNVVKSNTQSYFEKHYHNSTFHNFPHNNGILGGSATTTTTTLSSLIHQQQQPPLSSHHINSSTIITSSMPPPLIHYNQQSQQSSTSSFYTAHTPQQIQQHAPSNSNNKLGGDHHQQHAKNSETESAVSKVNDENSSAEVNATGEQLDVAMTDEACDDAVVAEETDEPEIDIVISNVVCAFNVRSALQLKEIALHGINVEYKRENGMVTMKLRKPYTTASIWSSGKITCTGATSEDQARVAARRYARILQKLNFRVRFQNYRVVNVLGTCKMPFAIKIVQFSEKYKKEASYEPELHPGVTYNLKEPKATLKIFSTGSMTVTAGSVAYVQAAIEHIYPLVYEFKKPRIEKEQRVEETVAAIVVESDMEDDDDDEDTDDEALDPLAMENREPSPPPNKKQKLRDISHLQKRYKGAPPSQMPQKTKRRGGAKRPLGKMNDPKEDLIYVSDGDDF